MEAKTIDALAALTPLKVQIVSDKSIGVGHELAPFAEALTRAFQGGFTQTPDGSDRYYAFGEDLGVDVRRIFFKTDKTDKTGAEESPLPAPIATDTLEHCGHLLVVVFLQDNFEANSAMAEWLNKVAEIAISPEYLGRIGILPVVFTNVGNQISLPAFSEFQGISITELGEHALRPGNLGLLVLQQAWSLLGTNPDERLKLFVSHAKRDGAPVALSLKSQIESLRFLSRFYDAVDIMPGTRWRRALENGVRKSTLLALRTDIYEQRAWCLQEMDWAEEFGCPSIVVDLRQATQIPRESLPVSDLSTVRIQDGNLVRVLNSALREAVRLRLFQRKVDLLTEANVLEAKTTLVVSRVSLSALGVACSNREKSIEMSKEKVNSVIIPEPFRETLRPIANRLVQAYFPEAKLGTPRDFV